MKTKIGKKKTASTPKSGTCRKPLYIN